jgi:putative intracellular protease/amidase
MPGRFYKGFPWRFVFTDLNSVVTTWASGLQRDRTLSFSLGQAATIEGAVRPDDFRVNGIWTDGYPRIAQSNRLVYAFRREGGGTPWICRGAGTLMSPDDQGDADVPISRFVAYDSRKLLEGRPAVAVDGALPGSQGFRLLSGSDFATGAEIVLTFLMNTIVNHGTVRIDAGVAWGGTAFYAGTIEATDPLDLNVQQGQSVADVWSAVEQSGNCDLILTPIYDPINRPGYTHELSIYRLAGIDHYDVVFGWDVLNRNLKNIERLHDGTPGSFFNVVQWYAGQGGPPVPSTGPLENVASVTAFGQYWSQQFFPSLQTSITSATALLALMTQSLELVKQGKRTLTLETVTERAPVPLRDYTIGDRVNVHASKRLRVTADGLQRVQTIPIQISDDGIETCPGILTSPDYRVLGT